MRPGSSSTRTWVVAAAPEAADAVMDVARGYANVELELDDGRRGGVCAGWPNRFVR